MGAEKLTNALHEKMSAEQEKFRTWLVAQAAALLESLTPLADAYKKLEQYGLQCDG